MKIAVIWKARAVMAVLILVFAFGGRDVEKIGDDLQIALPVLALGCALTNGQAVDFLARYAVQLAVVHGSKRGLGEAALNQRPSGKSKGMPSGHMATAALGASNLVYECVAQNPWVKGAVILSAGFVGGTRLEADAHDIWQVMAGVLVGWLVDRAFRKLTLRAMFARLKSKFRQRAA